MKHFRYKQDVVTLIEDYFDKTINNQSSAKIIEHPTIAGLAVYLGFNSKEDFALYESKGLFRKLLQKARFRLIAYYESRLLLPSPTGAIAALKSMGWEERSTAIEKSDLPASIQIKLIETGPQPASSEKEVTI